MNTIRAQLCLGIISYILFQGGSSQSPRVQSLGFQQGNKPSTFTAHSAPQSTTGIPVSLRMSTLVTTMRGESSNPRTSTLNSFQSSPFGPTMKTQTQEATLGRAVGTSALSHKTRERSPIPTSSVATSDIIPKSTTMNLRTTEKPVFPTPTSETVLTVAAFDPQKPDSCGMSESSTANREKDTSITLISMKNINSNNNKGCFTEEKVL
ncbi:endothelial cell-specific chemotaxis regulator isoform X3 [Antechinus flavipes]|uniref:endothelial cell-specific chemotaxis regulator isoform X3 n=1 Tax=Antechinus flavipes TaxID=38775 RepID=UPI0022354C9C|nr:endothelial cell-specific chemotaxis regulator isoform X3 [Antechinus flavipes]